MTPDVIISKMNTYLHTSANILADWLEETLPKTTDIWWRDCVLDNLSYNQRNMAEVNGYTELREFDLAALLRIADKSWYIMQDVLYLPNKERECIREMMHVRNNWAHISAELPGKDRIIADLNTIREFIEQRAYDIELINEIYHMIDEIKSPSTPIISEPEPEIEPESEVSDILSDDEIREMSTVYLVGDPGTRGIVMSVKDIGDTKKYSVFVGGEKRTYYSGQIALVKEAPSYNWVDIDTFRSCMTAYQINNPSASDLYSLNAARIDFVPYQFRPALKMINADEPRILIADSVGVGKTIEAGLIIKELEARDQNGLNSILIICPKPLVAERKWEMEMKRFDEEFIPLNGSDLRQIISDTDRDGGWPLRNSKCIIPYSILDGRTYHGESNKRGKSFGLTDLDPKPHFDLVIIDEAHHIRNGSMEKEKAFEYKCVKYFCDNADAVVMLTATPLQTSDNDLFTLLNVLRPDVVLDKETFDLMSRPNEFISKCSKAARRADEGWQDEVIASLNKMCETTHWGENIISTNPVFSNIMKTLKKNEISREERVKLISDIESLHSFNSMLNRTRRKDIQDFCIRRPYTITADFTDKQKELHDELLRFEASALSALHSNARSIPFMMSTIRRQAASCIFGLAPYIRNLVERRFAQLSDDPSIDLTEVINNDKDTFLLSELAGRLLIMAENLPEEDPKFDNMLSAIIEKQKLDNNKIILFSTFRHTLAYLRKKLTNAGLRVAQVDGSAKDIERQALRARFELPKNDEEALDILLFTEVGSEGLDYQFCNTMINYDLPWNPMSIEQRIGRIDRRGQKSEAVSIYNIITRGTVDADIYERCLKRIGVFESSIGECDEILGEAFEQIEAVAIDTSLTDEERRRKLDQIADNEIRRAQELTRLEESEKELFGFNLSEVMTSQEIQNAENPWLSQGSLKILVDQYLEKKLGAGTYLLGDKELKQLRLSAGARADLREDYRKLKGNKNAAAKSWDAYLKGNAPIRPITFDPETAERNRDAIFVTPMHPLAKQAAEYIGTNGDIFIQLDYSGDDFPSGRYRFSVYAWKYVGMNPHVRLMIVCDDDDVAADMPMILNYAASRSGREKTDIADWSGLESKQIDLWKEAKSMEIQESESTAKYKLGNLESNFKNKKRSLEQKISDSVDERILRMYKGELENVKEKYERKAEEIRAKVAQTDIHSTLIANGILNITN